MHLLVQMRSSRRKWLCSKLRSPTTTRTPSAPTTSLLFVFPAEALQLWTCTASAALQTDCPASFLICSLVRLIFAAEERLFPLVLIAPLQVCAHLFSYQIQS